MKNIILVFLILLASCAGSSKKAAKTFDTKKIHKGQSSYYYYLMSQIKKEPENFKESDSYLDQALKKDGDSSYLWAQKALHEAKKSHWDQALKFAERSLSENPKNVDSLILMGKLYAAKRNATKALTYYRRALTIDRKIEEIYNVMAREYLTLADKGNAVHTLKICLNEIPDSMSCLYYLATIQQQFKNYNESLKYFNMIRQLNPDNPKILQTMAELYLHKKNYPKAIEIIKQIQQLMPSDVTQNIRLGLIYYEMKEVDKAIAEFQSVYERFSKSDRINYFLGLLYLEKRDWDRAYQHFDNIQTKSPFFKEGFNRMIFILRIKGDVMAAIDLLDKKIGKKEQTPELVGLKLTFLISDGKYKKALTIANQGLSKYKDNVGLLFQRGVILDKLDRWEDAKEDFKKIIAAKPNSEKAFNYLGYTMLERGKNVDEAFGYIQSAHNLSPKDGHITDSLAWAYYKKGNIQKALTLLHRANKQKPKEPTILEHIGDLYFKLKNKKLARYYYQKSIQILEKIKRRTADEEKQLTVIREKLGMF